MILHGFTLDGANKKVKEILFSCIKNKYKEILIITGKGIHSTNDKDVYRFKRFRKIKIFSTRIYKVRSRIK